MTVRDRFHCLLGLCAALGLLAVGLSPGSASAQQPAWPSRPIRWVAPYPAGGAGDIVTRTVAAGLPARLGQDVVVENRPGANGLIGTEAVARAAPDGYTIVLGVFGPLTVIPHMQRLNFDPRHDLAPVALMVSVPNLVVVPAASPIQSFADLVAAARARPGELPYGSVGVGSSGQLAAALLGSMAGIRMTNVPYSGGAPAQVDLIGGRLSMMFDNASASLPHIREGRLRALAITSDRRSPVLPDLPTVAELGYLGYENSVWMGVLAPGRTPAPIVERLNREVVATLNDPAVRARLEQQLYDVRPSTPEEFARHIAAEWEKWGRVVRENNLTAAN
jgi:tripartite-type tricarboxylate transporter receptor subunit TctC